MPSPAEQRRRLARLALARGRRGVRPRPDAGAAREPRRPAARLPGDPRRRHERQVDRDADDRGAPARRGPVGRRDRLAARALLGRADHGRRRGGGLRARRSGACGPRPRQRGRRSSRRHRGGARRVRGARVDVAVVEAGLGGRLDATNVLRTHVVLLTNVGLEHTDVLGETREADRGREARRRAGRERSSCSATREFAHARRPERASVGGAARGRRGVPRPPGRARRSRSRCPGRLERRGDERDLGRRAQRRRRRAGSLDAPAAGPATSSSPRSCADKDVDGDARRARARSAARFVATQSSNARALPADELARLAARAFRARRGRSPIRPRRSPGPASSGPVLVTGSLYLLADLREGATA